LVLSLQDFELHHPEFLMIKLTRQLIVAEPVPDDISVPLLQLGPDWGLLKLYHTSDSVALSPHLGLSMTLVSVLCYLLYQVVLPTATKTTVGLSKAWTQLISDVSDV
jgi:hypothetical protein